MNKQERINTALRQVNKQYRLDKNSIRINTHNKFIHELGKFCLAWELTKQDKEIYTEVTFKDKKGRADIFVPEDFRICEVLESETIEKFNKKKNYYPEIFDLNAEKALDIFNRVVIDEEVYDNLICPNCYEPLEIEGQLELEKEIYDKYICKNCSHIVVLDYNSEANEK